MRRGAKLVAAVVAAAGVGLIGPPSMVPCASADVVPDALVNQLALQLGNLDTEVRQLQSALAVVDHRMRIAEAKRNDARTAATSKQQLEARLLAQARAYAVQRYMYGSTDSTDLLAFLTALDKPADDAVWGLAALEITSADALDHAAQVGKARAAISNRLTALESDVLVLRTTRARRAQLLTDAKAKRATVAVRFDGAVRDLGQATVNGMTTVAYQAYRRAQATLAVEQPSCGLRWELLAAIGKTESNHGAGRLDAAGNSLLSIIGIPIGADSDGGLLDGDAARDHAVGPMQFIPSTWVRWGTDANGDAKADPGNIVDAATAAGRYLCRAAGTLTLKSEDGVIRAILAYNPNLAYLRIVGARFQALASDLAAGWFSAASLPTPPPLDPSVQPNSPKQGRTAPGSLPTPPPPPHTTVFDVQLFGAHDLATSTTAPLPELPATCVGPSLRLDDRAGFVRCQPSAPSTLGVLDPCQSAPYDPTLVACLPDPTGTPTLLRVPAPAPGSAKPAAPAPPPPFRLLVLDSGDRCLPIAGAPSPTPPPSTTTSTTTAPAGRRGRSTSTTPVSAANRPAARPRAGGRASSTTTSTSSTTSTTRPPRSTSTTRPPRSTSTTTSTSTTAAPTTTTIPLAERPTYTCASGLTVLGEPDQSLATWTVRVREPGLADRVLVVLMAYA